MPETWLIEASVRAVWCPPAIRAEIALTRINFNIGKFLRPRRAAAIY